MPHAEVCPTLFGWTRSEREIRNACDVVKTKHVPPVGELSAHSASLGSVVQGTPRGTPPSVSGPNRCEADPCPWTVGEVTPAGRCDRCMLEGCLVADR